MTYKKLLLLGGFLLALAITTEAQNFIDAMRYSSIGQVGTARNISLGGTMGSVGGDFSNLSTNPAGLGRYKSNEFHVSPAIIFGGVDATYLGNTLSDEHLNVNFSSAGIVIGKPLGNTGWKSFAIGFGMNRLDQYNEEIIMSGLNTNNSILDLHAARANGIAPENLFDALPFDAGLSYNVELLEVDSNNIYTSSFRNTNPQQTITLSRSGGKYEAAIGGSANYEDKVYVGASIGIPILRFSETRIIQEENPDSATQYVNFFNLTDEVSTTGYGVNFKVGILAVPHKYVRLGFGFHSPSLIRMSDNYLTSLIADNDAFLFETEPVLGEFDYNLVTPWRFLGNAAFFMGKYGFISTEYELMNQGQAKFKFKSNDAAVQLEETSRNNQIAETFTWQHSVKLGAEFKVDPVRVRAGFQYRTSGLADNGSAQLVFSGGLGYRAKHIFVDGSYSFTSNSMDYIPYGSNRFNINSGTANFNGNNSQITFTIGYKL